ncbi:MAG: hypothetical protein ACTHQE_15185 [Thermomicrobiales bacterium]
MKSSIIRPIVTRVRAPFQMLVLALTVFGFVLGSLLAPSGAAAYEGQTWVWVSEASRGSDTITVLAYDTGDVYSNTNFVNAVDAATLRDLFGEDIRSLRGGDFLTPYPNTTAVRLFTLKIDGQDGFLVVTDEYGPHVWFFLFTTTDLYADEVDTFVQATVNAGRPTAVPSGFDRAVLLSND